MNILIVYGTNSSATYNVVESVGNILTVAGHHVTVQHARDTVPSKLSEPADCLILASCTWERFTAEGKRLEGELQQHMYSLVEAAKVPAGRRFAVIGLGDSSYTEFCAAADHLESAIERWSGKLIVPTLRIDGYFFDLEKNRAQVTTWAEALVKVLA